MKYGLLICKNTDNIGDDIQTYAQKRFLPKVDCFVDREQLDTFFPEEKWEEPVAVIMNAWYMYQKFNWPPSPYIFPLFISIHISPKDYFGIGTDFLDGMGGEYLKQYEPIGARDLSTLQILREKGVDAYLSGCLTLTVQLHKKKQPNDIVYLVDVDLEAEAVIKKMFPDENYRVVHHAVNYSEEKISYEARMQRVEHLLEQYQDAKCVITSRLHCALPCLALETPVLLIYEDEYENRIKTFLNLLYYVRRNDLLEGHLSYNVSSPNKNKTKYLEIKMKLEETCNVFITKCEEKLRNFDTQEIINWRYYWLEQATWQKSLLGKSEWTFRQELNKQQEWIKNLEKDKEWFHSQLKNYKAREKELQEYIESLVSGKDWLEQNFLKQKKYIDELINTKIWLENQAKEHETYIESLVSGKDWLEKKTENQTQAIEKQETMIVDLEQQVNELKNLNSKLQYQLEVLKKDKMVQKIIKLKKYQV